MTEKEKCHKGMMKNCCVRGQYVKIYAMNITL